MEFFNISSILKQILRPLGIKTESQILAVECLCNLSLGSEHSCERIAQRAGTYLHTFLQSSNESLVVSINICNVKMSVIF